MTCFVPVYIPFLHWQQYGVDSWDFASHWHMLWHAPPYVLFSWMACPVGSAWPQWVCPLFFPESLSWLRFASCRAEAGSTVTGLSNPDHSQWPWVLHSDTAGTDDVVRCLLKNWLSTRAVLSELFDLTCVLYVSILSKWIPRCLRLLMRSMTSPLKETAGNAFPTALLLWVHHRACALLGLISESVSWHQCDTFSNCSRTAVTAFDVTGRFVDKPIVRKPKHQA